MKFKFDENLPIDAAGLLCAAQHDAVMVTDQGPRGAKDARIAEVCSQEGRILVTLDLDFADVRAYRPQQFAGIMVLRLRRQDKGHLLSVLQQTIPLLDQEPIRHRLWIVEETRVRIRGESPS